MITTEELEKLAELKNKGIITEDEFNAKREEFLGQLGNKNSNKEKNNDTSSGGSVIGTILGIIVLYLVFSYFSNGGFRGGLCIKAVKETLLYEHEIDSVDEICSNSKVSIFSITGKAQNGFGAWSRFGSTCVIDKQNGNRPTITEDKNAKYFLNLPSKEKEKLCNRFLN